MRFKGWLKGIRHVATPSVGFRFSPNYQDPDLEYFKKVDTDLRVAYNDPQMYSIFLSNPVGTPSISERQMSMTFSLSNNFEAKYRSRKDSSDRKMKLLDRVNLNTDYNFAKDSLNWNYVSLSTSTQIFNKIFNVSFGARMDPYDVFYTDAGSRVRVNKFIYNTKGRLLRFDRADLNITGGLSIDQFVDIFRGERDGPEPKADSKAIRGKNRNDIESERSLYSLFKNFRLRYGLMVSMENQQFRDTTFISNHYVELQGNVQLTKNWSVGISRIGYNFVTERVTYPDLSLTRDLHCWQLRFSWQPDLGTYSLFLGVKPGSLDFIKVPYRQNNVDSRF